MVLSQRIILVQHQLVIKWSQINFNRKPEEISNQLCKGGLEQCTDAGVEERNLKGFKLWAFDGAV